MTENKAVATKSDDQVPDYLRDSAKVKFGNTDSSDIIIPRVKLLQSVSPELTDYDGVAKNGDFWHTLAEQSLGKELKIIPIILKKEIVLWAPRGDDRGILARSSDCVNWDDGFENLEFKIKLKGVKEEVTWFTDANVEASGLMKFGSMNPNDPDSRPAAATTYRFMFLFPDFLELGPAIIINTRSAIKAARGLISKIELRPQAHYAQQFIMSTTDEVGDEGPYKGYKYVAGGFPSEAAYKAAQEAYEKFKDAEWKTNDEDEGATSSAGGNKGPTDSNAF